LSNDATLKGWPLIVVFADMAWGTLVTTLVCAVGYRVGLGRGSASRARA
jgi:uncharacterized membrane protein